MDNVNWRALIVFIGVSLSFPSIIRAEPLVQQIDRMELDWGNLKLRFFGTFKPDSTTNDLPYSEGEQHALSEGLLYARGVIAKIHGDELQRQGVSQELADRSALLASEYLTRTTYPYQTSYYKGGTIKILLENSLAKVFVRRDSTHAKASEDKKTASRFSGLILRLDKPMKPVATYNVVDQSGTRLLSVESVTRDAYEKNLMGRWFVEPHREELIRYLGSKPVSIQVKVVGADRLMVQKGTWTDALQDSQQILGEGRIALVVPK